MKTNPNSDMAMWVRGSEGEEEEEEEDYVLAPRCSMQEWSSYCLLAMMQLQFCMPAAHLHRLIHALCTWEGKEGVSHYIAAYQHFQFVQYACKWAAVKC